MLIKISNKKGPIYLREIKQVHRKEVTYDLAEWKKIEERAASVMLKTGTFIKRMSLEGKIFYFDMREVGEVMKALRIIGANINQIAHKANETNNMYADDIQALQGEINEIGHTFTLFLANIPKLMSAAQSTGKEFNDQKCTISDRRSNGN